MKTTATHQHFWKAFLMNKSLFVIIALVFLGINVKLNAQTYSFNASSGTVTNGAYFNG